MPSPTSAVALTHTRANPQTVTCGCGNTVTLTPPRRKSGVYSPTCPNCAKPTGHSILFERHGEDITLEISQEPLTSTERRVDRSTPAEALSELERYVAAKYPALMIQSQEPDRVVGTVYELCGRKNKNLFVWDCVQHLKQLLPPPGSTAAPEMQDIEQVLAEAHTLPERSVLVIRNFHAFLAGPAAMQVIQLIENNIHQWQHKELTLIGLAPAAVLPAELERLFTVVDAPLPSGREIERILKNIADKNALELPNDLTQLTRAASGLTRFEIENAACLSILRTNQLDPLIIAEEKGQLIKKAGSLTLGSYKETFADIGGMQYLRKWTLTRFAQHEARPELPFKGMLLVGFGGSGKSAFAKALGNHIGWPTLCMDFGQIYSGEKGREGIVGSAESMMRRALQIADAMAPCILFADEIEKGLGGVGSSNATDGGVGSRLFGKFLSWLQDHESDVFVIGCSNRLNHIPPEFYRSGRFDAVFFSDLPDPEERHAILDIYAKKYKVTIPSTIESDIGLDLWTGAELKQLCIEAAMNNGDFAEGARAIRPLYKSLTKDVAELRAWAATRCLPTNRAPQLPSDRTVPLVAPSYTGPGYL